MIDENEVAHLGVLLEDLFPEYARHMVTIVVNPKGTAKAWPAPPRPEEGPPRGSHGGEAVRTEAPRPTGRGDSGVPARYEGRDMSD
jgi:hypothetical protein